MNTSNAVSQGVQTPGKPLNSEHKIFQNQSQLRAQLDKVRRPLVFTNGCFDILHRGHVDYLEQAAQLGATLLVAVNSDESIRALGKGEDFAEETPLELIRLCRPDRLVKGGDWPVSEIIGADLVQVSGGTVHTIPIRYPCSTSKLLEKIRTAKN